jgi:hypothetical protein
MEKKTLQIIDLPQEILLKIIGYCSTSNILTNVGHVSKRMNVLSRDSTVGLTVRLSKNTQSKSAAKILQQRSNQIEKLVLAKTSEEKIQVVTDYIGSLTNLKAFIVFNWTIKMPKQFFIQLFQLKKLKKMDINCLIEDSSLLTIGECKKLKFLRINAEYNLSREEFMVFVNLRHIPKVVLSFNIDDLKIEHIQFPINVSIREDCELSLAFFVEALTYSLLNAIASYFPEMWSLDIFPKTHQAITKEYTWAIRTLFQKCKTLRLFITTCRLKDKVNFERKFKGWSVDYLPDSHTMIMMKLKSKH